MKINLMAVTLVGSALLLGGCDDKKDPSADAAAKMKDTASKAADATKDAAKATADATKDAANKVADATKDAAKKTADATKDTANKVADATKDAANKTAEAVKGMLDAKTKDAVTGYTADLSKLGDSLAGIKSVDDATKAFPGLKDQMTKISGYVGTLSTVSSDVKAKVMADFKPQIDAAVKKFHDQADRINKDMFLSKVPGLSDTLKNFKLFE